ncbi:MAG: NAD(P)H-dependent oxidoreductase subunit E [Ramlibacter sp.]|nr:NAD(P)H-dependent oxidoreductase subunit E [Ramlibacter sp.]
MDSANIDLIIEQHRGKPGDLIHVLMEIQHVNHWLPRDVLRKVAEVLEIPFSRVLRIATLYKTFSLTPKGRNEVQVCNGISCHLRGAKQVMEAVERATGIKAGETDANWRFSLDSGACLGSCSLGPEVIVNGKHHARMTPDKVEDVLKAYE